MATATVAHQDTAVHEHHEHEHHDHEHHDNFITKYIFTTDHKMINRFIWVLGWKGSRLAEIKTVSNRSGCISITRARA